MFTKIGAAGIHVEGQRPRAKNDEVRHNTTRRDTGRHDAILVHNHTMKKWLKIDAIGGKVTTLTGLHPQ
jgi:hypothetical protein